MSRYHTALAKFAGREIWQMTRGEFVSRKETIDRPDAFPKGTRRIGGEGYVHTLEDVPLASVKIPESNRMYEESIAYYQQKGKFAPPVVIRDKNSFLLDDGAHRIEAAKRDGKKSLLMWVAEASNRHWGPALYDDIVEAAAAAKKPVPQNVLRDIENTRTEREKSDPWAKRERQDRAIAGMSWEKAESLGVSRWQYDEAVRRIDRLDEAQGEGLSESTKSGMERERKIKRLNRLADEIGKAAGDPDRLMVLRRKHKDMLAEIVEWGKRHSVQ